MKTLRVFTVLWLSILVYGCAEDFMTLPSGPKYFRAAESDSWGTARPNGKGEYWLKSSFELPVIEADSLPLGVMISMLASTEVYWDGVLLGQNGKVGRNAGEETPGKLVKVFLIPSKLVTPGEHELLIHFSNHSGNGEFRIYSIVTGEYWHMARRGLIITSFAHIYAGFFLIICLYFLVRFCLDYRRIGNLLFSLISLAFFALILMEYIRAFYHYPYTWHFTRLHIILGITILIALLLPAFFSIQFEFSRKNIWLTFTVELLLILCSFGLFFLGYDIVTMWIMLIGFCTSLYIAFVAFSDRIRGSLLAIIGIAPIPMSVWYWYSYYDYIIFAGFGHLTLMTLIALALREQEQRRSRQEALLMSSRLEKELLKKNIQPHFLMNSLMSAIDWIEENPSVGIDLLYALVKEFDILVSISDHKQIPLEQEIALCQAHLAIMSFRREKNFHLQTFGILTEEQIPPAILHTIIENGVTHNTLDQKDIHFEIHFRQERLYQEYYVFCENGPTQDQESIEDGTGLQYIKARLEESYFRRWELISRGREDGWETVIRIFRS